MQLKTDSTLQSGKYRIVKALGQGGFGITYLAEQVMLGRKVAVKEFFMKELCERDESTSHVTLGIGGSKETVNRFREKFLKEARNIAKLNHPNIVRIIDVFEENGTAYYVMEFAECGSLADKIKQQGCLPEPVAKRYILQIASALEYIHQLKMNHLDIKPANVMLNEKDEAILIDFGLSKQYDATTGNQTSTTPVGISEGYAPMEQYRQGGVGEFSPQTDIYALGATYFKILTGATPPSASDVNEEGVPVNELEVKGVSTTSINTICKAMEGRKRDRWESVSLFISSLDASAPSKNDSDPIADMEEETKILQTPPPAETNEERIHRIAMERYQEEQRKEAERLAIEKEIQKIKEEEARQKAAEEAKRAEEEERQKKASHIDEAEKLLHGVEEDNAILFGINGVKFKMIKVQGGTFEMKETLSCGFLGLSSKETVQKTTLSGYFIGQTEVTQALWKVVMGFNPSCFKGDNLPVENVSWDDCQLFLEKLNNLAQQVFRLPTEAEWEFAARGGLRSKHYKFSGRNTLPDIAWYTQNADGKTHDVATKLPNELGIYDMNGNVWEWCHDYKGDYSSNDQINPTGPDSGTRHVIRGGSFGSNITSYGDLSFRLGNEKNTRCKDLGLRLALTL